MNEGIKLRPYQDDTVTGTREAFARGSRRVGNVLPTGSGKTTIFGKMCSEYRKRQPNKRAVIVSHLGLLTSQTGDRFRDEWGLDTQVLQADRLPTAEAQTIITTMQSFRSKEKLLRWAAQLSFRATTLEQLNIGLIIIDECHLVGNDSYQKILSMFPDAYVIGFTATPFRQNKLMSNLFDEVAYTISTQELIDQGYLVAPKLRQVDYDTTDQADMFAKIIRVYKDNHKGQKAVVYLKTIAEAELLRNVLVEAGIKSSAVTSKLTGDKRDEVLSSFRNNTGADILTTVDVLTAGFDSPNLRAIFMPYKVGSVTTYLQRVGRGLRPDTGKTHCDIYINSEAPNIDEGFWEKINKQMLSAGKREYDNYQELLDYGEMDFSAEEYTWTKDVVAMANEVKAKGMDNLSSMIINKEFPPEMLDVFVDFTPTITRKGACSPATKDQLAEMKKWNYNAEGLSKQECAAVLLANGRRLLKSFPDVHLDMKEYQDDYVSVGRYKGRHFSEVPAMFWKFASKKNAPEWREYKQYKRRRDVHKK